MPERVYEVGEVQVKYEARSVVGLVFNTGETFKLDSKLARDLARALPPVIKKVEEAQDGVDSGNVNRDELEARKKDRQSFLDEVTTNS